VIDDDFSVEGLTEDELVSWGTTIGQSVGLPLVLALRGELGAGKSVLARSIARGAGVRGSIPSPTFNLLFHYETERDDGALEVWHLDLYRLEDPDDVWELGWRELGEGRQIGVIEWPERAEELLPPDRWDIYLESQGPEQEDRRRLRAIRVGTPPALPELRVAGEGIGS